MSRLRMNRRITGRINPSDCRALQEQVTRQSRRRRGLGAELKRPIGEELPPPDQELDQQERQEHHDVVEQSQVTQSPVRADQPRPADRMDDPAEDQQRDRRQEPDAPGIPAADARRGQFRCARPATRPRGPARRRGSPPR